MEVTHISVKMMWLYFNYGEVMWGLEWRSNQGSGMNGTSEVASFQWVQFAWVLLGVPMFLCEIHLWMGEFSLALHTMNIYIG
jgi:hypothetical protein